jgi:hypothetical protein
MSKSSNKASKARPNYFLVPLGSYCNPEWLQIDRQHQVEAVGLWLLAGSYCAGAKSGRNISFQQLEQIADNARVIAERLIEVGIWQRTETGIQFVNNSRLPNHAFQRGRPHIPFAVRNEVFARDGWTCNWCESPDELQIDHIIPWSKGGAHDITNFQTLCRICNRLKSDSL